MNSLWLSNNKLINNNFISSIDQNGNQVIIRGLGIGFQKKPGEWIKPDKVEAIYRIDDKVTSNKLQELCTCHCIGKSHQYI